MSCCLCIQCSFAGICVLTGHIIKQEKKQPLNNKQYKVKKLTLFVPKLEGPCNHIPLCLEVSQGQQVWVWGIYSVSQGKIPD